MVVLLVDGMAEHSVGLRVYQSVVGTADLSELMMVVLMAVWLAGRKAGSSETKRADRSAGEKVENLVP
jgi:hypothetical protein